MIKKNTPVRGKRTPYLIGRFPSFVIVDLIRNQWSSESRDKVYFGYAESRHWKTKSTDGAVRAEGKWLVSRSNHALIMPSRDIGRQSQGRRAKVSRDRGRRSQSPRLPLHLREILNQVQDDGGGVQDDGGGVQDDGGGVQDDGGGVQDDGGGVQDDGGGVQDDGGGVQDDDGGVLDDGGGVLDDGGVFWMKCGEMARFTAAYLHAYRSMT